VGIGFICSGYLCFCDYAMKTNKKELNLPELPANLAWTIASQDNSSLWLRISLINLNDTNVIDTRSIHLPLFIKNESIDMTYLINAIEGYAKEIFRDNVTIPTQIQSLLGTYSG
jgi:hypothetical protein